MNIDIFSKEFKNAYKYNRIILLEVITFFCLFIKSINETDLRKALAQVILTNKKQQHILNKVALIYRDKENNDILKLIDCSDDSIMYNNDINWKQEKPSMPSFDATNRINDRLIGNIITYTNEEIKLFFDNLLINNDIKINITLNNIQTIYNDWKNNITFKKEIKNEQDLINLFLVDILNGTKYEKIVKEKILDKEEIIKEKQLIREGIDLNKYKLIVNEEEARIEYDEQEIYKINNITQYKQLWKKYKRPPNETEFFNIIERSAKLYTDKYRRTTGAEYTPSCFVELQNQLLDKYYGKNWKNEYIVFDPCAGVGNLENDFGKKFKNYTYLSTLEKMDVDTCKIKGFENVKEFDYLKDDKHPTFLYEGNEKSITEICELENKKLMIIMNPPYQRVKGFKNNLAIEFFNKVLTLNPQVIVFYYQTESFLNEEINNYINSKYKIVSHIFSNAKTTFILNEWPISQIIFDKDKGKEIDKSKIIADRYELNYDGKKYYKNDKLYPIKSYTYNQEKPNLIKEIENKIKENSTGLSIGEYSYLSNTIFIGNGNFSNITTNNLKYCLLSKGINFNTHDRYFERNNMVYRGKYNEITEEIVNDSIMFSLYYKKNAFSNKSNENYIMPFTSEELNCSKNDLYVRRGGKKMIY